MPEKALDLSSPTSAVNGIGPAKYNALSDAGIHTINDLINHYPRKYLDRKNITQISKIKNKNLGSRKHTINVSYKVTLYFHLK